MGTTRSFFLAARIRSARSYLRSRTAGRSRSQIRMGPPSARNPSRCWHPLLARTLLRCWSTGVATRRRVVFWGLLDFFYLRVKGSGSPPHLLIETTQTVASAERSTYETATSDFALGIAAHRR